MVEDKFLGVDASRALDAFVAGACDLPCLPEATLATMHEAGMPAASPQSVAKQLSGDPALAARALRLANSPYYGLSGQVADLSEAVVVLGMRSVRNLAMVASGHPQGRRRDASALRAGLRRHALATAMGARMVAERTRSASGDAAFTAGLLHDLGRLALSVQYDVELRSAERLALRDQLSPDAAERRVIGFDHARLGARLAEAWGLPQPLVSVMRFHHGPDASERSGGLVDCVHIADHLASRLGLEFDGLPRPLAGGSLVRLRLTLADLPGLTERLRATYEEHEASVRSAEDAGRGLRAA